MHRAVRHRREGNADTDKENEAGEKREPATATERRRSRLQVSLMRLRTTATLAPRMRFP